MRLNTLIIALSLSITPATSFPPWRTPATFKASSSVLQPRGIIFRRSSPSDDNVGDELDLESMSRADLERLMADIGGPPLDTRAGLDEARDAIWCFLGDAQEEDLDAMCLTQLSALMVTLGGPAIADDTPVAEARDATWNFVESLDDGVFEYAPEP